MCRFGCRVIRSFDIASVTVPKQVLVHLVRRRCIVGSVELLCRKQASHSSVHHFFYLLFTWFSFQASRLERFSTLTLWYHEKNGVRKQTRKAKNRKLNLYIVCVQWTLLYKSFKDWQKYWQFFNAHLWAPTLTTKYIPPGFYTDLAFLRTCLRTGLRTRPHWSMPTDPVLGGDNIANRGNDGSESGEGTMTRTHETQRRGSHALVWCEGYSIYNPSSHLSNQPRYISRL